MHHKSPNPYEYTTISCLIAVLGGAPWRSCQEIPPGEFGAFMARGGIAMAAWFAAAIGYTIIGQTLYGDHLAPGLIIAIALIAATFVSVIDIAFLYRFPLFRLGLRELARAGLRLPSIGGVSSWLATAFEIARALVTGTMVGLFTSLLAYSSDISIQTTADFLNDNKAIAQPFEAAVDASIKRAAASVDEETVQVRNFDHQISVLQQSEVRSALRAGRKHAAPATPDVGAQLASLEAKRTSAYARLDEMKGELARLTEGRNATILKAIETAPNHTLKRDGVLGRLATFRKILEQNPHLLLIVAAIELIAVSLELGPVIAHAVYTPSGFAARFALEHLKTVTALASEGASLLASARVQAPAAAEVNAESEQGHSPDQAPSGAPTSGDAPHGKSDISPPQPPKRGRGRPRRTPPTSMPNGHAPSPLTTPIN